MLSGDAAAALAEVARQRWRLATGQMLKPVPAEAADPWPPQVEPAMRGVTVAIARTLPAWEGGQAVREVERLYLDMVAAARRFILLENQYFASRSVSRALLSRLAEDAAPDLVVISCQEPVVMLERTTMGAGRARLTARLRRADRGGRLRLYTPVNHGQEIKVHTKLAVIDDTVLRVGSANLNNRSMGLDTECDVLIEALGDPEIEAAIRRIRCDLLAEHLGTSPERVDLATARLGVGEGVDSLRGGPRDLVPVELPDAPADLMAELFDPDVALEAALVDATEATIDKATGGPALPRWLDRATIDLAVSLLVGAAYALAWRIVPEAMSGWLGPAMSWALNLAAGAFGLPAVLLAFVVGGLLNVPMTLLLAGCGALYGPWLGWPVGLAGALASALAGFAIGRAAGRDRVRRRAGSGMSRVVRALPRRGILMVALLRLVPVASYGVVNLVAGAARMRLANYLLGTVMGMVPVAGALTLFGDRLAAVARRGDPTDLAVLSILTAALVIIEASLARRVARGAVVGGLEQGDGRV
jgi:uncharacterized membrane protein YdjX (TVP38/TMEM64 family)